MFAFVTGSVLVEATCDAHRANIGPRSGDLVICHNRPYTGREAVSDPSAEGQNIHVCMNACAVRLRPLLQTVSERDANGGASAA